VPKTPPSYVPLVDESWPYTPNIALLAAVLLFFVVPLTPRPFVLMPATPAPLPVFVPLMHGEVSVHV